MTTVRLLGSLDIAGTPAAPSRARDYLREVLDPAHHAIEDATLLVSELVTNAVVHTSSGGGGTVGLTVTECPDGGILVEVADGGAATVPEPVRIEDELIPHGRGLFLVERIAADWSHRRGPAGTVTWFRVAPPDGERRAQGRAPAADSGSRAIRRSTSKTFP